MSLWSRAVNVLKPDRLNRELDEEFMAHIEEAIGEGRDPGEARQAFGSTLRQREASRDIRLIMWLDSLRADAVFGWRQLKKKKVTSAAAILSLALAIGSCTSAFRLIDALLLRPLPIAEPERLYIPIRRMIDFDGKLREHDSLSYPSFRQMNTAVKEQAELIAISYAGRTDITYGSDEEMEKVYRQYVSGRMFQAFGLRPAMGRLLTENDDVRPGAHPYAVLSHDYWTSRFARDPKVIGRTFRMANDVYEIVGVAGEGFTGTEPGTVTGIFIPAMMHPAVGRGGSTWLRTFVRMNTGIAVEAVRQRLHASNRAFEQERAKGFRGIPRQSVENFVNQSVTLEPAAAGVSEMQKDYSRSLTALGVLVAMVLLIACANVANLMTAQAAARAREMALRVAIGAGHWRLVQLVLLESAWVAFLAAGLGWMFAWWSAPFVVSMINPPDNPARLVLPADWRVFGFAIALAIAVTFLFGLIPALRASAVKPAIALKGGDDPLSRRRLMHALIAVQVAFCFLVLFVAGQFVATFHRLSAQPTGFSAERLLTLETIPKRGQLPADWDQVAEHLRTVAGVETVALASSALLNGWGWNDFISINGAPPGEIESNLLSVSPGWTGVMKIPFIDGRDFRAGDTSPGAAIVNEAFAKQYFNGENPVGKSFEKEGGRFQIVGFVRDARYRSMREPVSPTAYVPVHGIDAHGSPKPIDRATFIVRTSGLNPLALAATLRREVARARPEFRVSNIRTQLEINQSNTVRERLLAMLALFFAAVALVLAGVGLYGVLNYSVLQRRREIGIRMAIGARPGSIARLVTVEVFCMVLAGAAAGLALGIGSARHIESLVYQTKSTDLSVLGVPAMAILAAAILAALPAVIHAVRIDPVQMLRS